MVRALTRPGYGWANHPAVLMEGIEEALGRYGFACCEAWTELGFGDTCALTIATDLRAAGVDTVRTQPELAAARCAAPWLGDEAVHRSHQSSLVRKDASTTAGCSRTSPTTCRVVAGPVRGGRRRGTTQGRERGATTTSLERARLDAERLRRKRSRAAKAWQTRRQNPPGRGAGSVLPTTDDSPATTCLGSARLLRRSRLESSCRSVWSVERRAWSTDP